LQEKGVSAGVVNMRFAKPLDTEMLFQDARDTHCIVTMEEGAVIGGVGEVLVQALNNHGLLDKTLVLNFGIPDEFISQGDRKLLLRDIGLTPELMADRILDWMKKA